MWRHLGYSIRGAAHEGDGTPCQDSNLVQLLGEGASTTLVACVADGAGSSKHSNEGSAIACEVIGEQAKAFFEKHGDFEKLHNDDVMAWCEDARQSIDDEAAMRDCSSREFATTLCAAIVSPGRSIFFQIGDGAITIGRDGMYGVVFWPQTGEYANSTNFLTAKLFSNYLEYLAVPGSFTDVALFTDGLERLALNFEAQTPHTPFFNPLFKTLRTAEDLDSLGGDFQQFLMSPSISSRSDDDKSLILASSSVGENRKE